VRACQLCKKTRQLESSVSPDSSLRLKSANILYKNGYFSL